MNYSELLKSKNIKITVSATKIKHMLEAYALNSEFLTAFKNLYATRDGESITPQMFLTFVNDNLTILSQINGKTKIDEIITDLFKEVIHNKSTMKEEIK